MIELTQEQARAMDEQAVLGSVIGSLSVFAMQEIEKCLEAVLEIP